MGPPTLHQLASHKINSSQTRPGHSGVEVLSQLTSVCVRLTPEANCAILSSLHKCSVTVRAVQQGGGFPSGPAWLLCVLQPKCVASSAIRCFKDLFLFYVYELVSACVFVHCAHAWYMKRVSFPGTELQVLVSHLIVGVSDHTWVFCQEQEDDSYPLNHLSRPLSSLLKTVLHTIEFLDYNFLLIFLLF